MYCENCGIENLEAAKFCKECGQRFEQEAQRTGEIEPVKEESLGKSATRGRKYVVILTVIAVLAIVGALYFKKETIINFFNSVKLGETSDELSNEQAQEKFEEAGEIMDAKNNTESETEVSSAENAINALALPAVEEDEKDDKIEVIKRYYALLSAGKLEEAYQMRYDREVAFDNFKEWYQDVQYLDPYDFAKTALGSYDFRVDLKETNGAIMKYNVEMEVIGDKIKTIYSIEATN